jgi:hypothetical protein
MTFEAVLPPSEDGGGPVARPAYVATAHVEITIQEVYALALGLNTIRPDVDGDVLAIV